MSDHKPTTDEIAMAQAAGLEVQPDPMPNDLPSAHDLVIKFLKAGFKNEALDTPSADTLSLMFEDLLEMYVVLNGGSKPAIKEMKARKRFGLKKYGTILQPFNGRDALGDSRDELGDLVVYMAVKLYEIANDNDPIRKTEEENASD